MGEQAASGGVSGLVGGLWGQWGQWLSGEEGGVAVETRCDGDDLFVDRIVVLVCEVATQLFEAVVIVEDDLKPTGTDGRAGNEGDGDGEKKRGRRNGWSGEGK